MQKRDENGRIIRKPKEILIGGEVIPECKGCENQFVGLCKTFRFPEAKWRYGNCNMATHTITRTKETDKFKRRVGQQKGKKK